MSLKGVSVGDIVYRYFGDDDRGGQGLSVSRVEDGVAHCGPWAFDIETGAEIDDDLEWGPKYGVTGSFAYLQPKEKP